MDVIATGEIEWFCYSWLTCWHCSKLERGGSQIPWFAEFAQYVEKSTFTTSV